MLYMSTIHISLESLDSLCLEHAGASPGKWHSNKCFSFSPCAPSRSHDAGCCGKLTTRRDSEQRGLVTT